MPLDTTTAAEVAREHGLTLSDAQALAVLADTRDEATDLAARFAPPSNSSEPDDMANEVIRRIRGTV